MTAPPYDAARRPPADARNTITPEAFRLAPELLGTPLARPWRRAVAMGIDGVLIAILSNAPGVLFAFAGAWVLLRISGKPVEGSTLRRRGRRVFRIGGAIVLFIAVLAVWNDVRDRIQGEVDEVVGDGVEKGVGSGDDEGAEVDDDDEVAGAGRLSGMDGVKLAGEIALFAQATDEATARRRAGELLPLLRRAGMDEADIRELFTELAADPEKPWLSAAADSVIAGLERPAPAVAGSPDSLIVAYAAAVAANDSAAAAELRPRVALSLAADTLADLRTSLREERHERAEAERKLEEAEEKLEEGTGVIGTIRAFADDLGLGLGWAGLYFTAFLTLWSGATPGKRLLGIRVIRLDGKPMGWWASFERFGGYAAGVATGLLGFAQIFWDRNRQAVQDKISETVVVNSRSR